ncbi:autotransporter adhesin Ag43, partial [Escherichia coli]|nr:autotransporter adhesin Ag43 [Escherichia coli]
AATVTGTNRLGHFSVGNGMADNVVLENGGRLDVLEGHSAQNTLVDDGGILAVSAGGKATDVTMTSGSALIADSGATVEGTNASGKFSIDGTSGQASGLLLENGGSFTVNAGGLASNTTVGHRGTLTLAAGGSLSGRTQLSKGASMVLNGDVVSTGDIVNAGEIYFDNQTTPDAVLSRAVAKGNAPVTFHKLTTSNLTGQGGTINMRVRLDGSNASDQLVINGGQATGKTWLAFTNVGNSNLGVATSGQGIRVVDAQNGATTEEGAFALSRPLQAGAFNYTLNRDSDEDWYLRSENAYRAEVPLYASMLTQAMDYDRILAGSRSHQTGVSGENNSVRLSIQGGHLGHDNNGGIARGATPESSGSYGFVRLEGDLLRTEVAGMSLTTGVYGAAGHSSVDVKDDDGSRAGTVRDDAGSLGGYLNLVHTSSGLWADIVAQGTRHSMKA